MTISFFMVLRRLESYKKVLKGDIWMVSKTDQDIMVALFISQIEVSHYLIYNIY